MDKKEVYRFIDRKRREFLKSVKGSSYSLGPFSSLSGSSNGVIFKGKKPSKRFQILLISSEDNLPSLRRLRNKLYNGRSDIKITAKGKYKSSNYHLIIEYREDEYVEVR